MLIFKAKMAKVKLCNSTRVALIDDEDLGKVSLIKWRLMAGRNTAYAVGWDGKTQVLLHRLIMSAKGREQSVDHINGDGLDNRRANLRICTIGENNANRAMQKRNAAGYKGVSFDNRAGRWHARITKDGKVYSLGLFGSKEEAAAAYDKAAKILHGQFARINQY